MPSAQRNKMNVTVVDDLWTELGMARPSVPMVPFAGTPPCFFRPWKLSIAAVVLTALLHGLVGVGMFTNFGGFKTHRMAKDTTGQLAAPNATSQVVSILTLISDQFDSSQAETNKRIVAKEMINALKAKEPVEKVPPTLELIKSEGAATVASDATGSGSQPRTLRDIYLGQIKARVERAWGDSQKARMAIGNCHVNITQGKQGEVRRVEVQDCIATTGWKQSLETAIRQASPLPAPPDEKVFSEEVSLEF
jgi:hypothetical protein